MALINVIQTSLKVSASAFALLCTFYSVVELMLFLSDPTYWKTQNAAPDNSWLAISWSLIIDQLLLSLFMLQHSVFALQEVKKWLSSSKLQTLQRTIYVTTTSLVLLIIIKYWRATPRVSLWHINADTQLYWWCFLTLHLLAWLTIYVGTICMDINELLGLKQVYYNIQGLPDPTTYKSLELTRLYKHMRHPSFIGFLIIFWAVPVMSLDRLLLAVIWSLYMYLTWNTDQHDYNYQQLQFNKKFHNLHYQQ